MVKMTSAVASKMVRKLCDDKAYYLSRESEGRFYIAAIDEEAVIPEYDYEETSKIIADIDRKVVAIKHAINQNNVMNCIVINGQSMTIDAVLVRMAQLSSRRGTLDYMRKQEAQRRVNSIGYGNRKTVPEYQYINYDIEMVKRDYEKVDAEIAMMQIELDKYNQTFEFEVDIDM